MAFIQAVNKNGKKQTIPEHWLDHPKLGKGFRRSRRRQAQQSSAPQSPSAPRAAVATPGDSKAGTSSANTDTAPSADQEG